MAPLFYFRPRIFLWVLITGLINFKEGDKFKIVERGDFVKAFLLFEKDFHHCLIEGTEKEYLDWEEIEPMYMILADSIEEVAKICGGSLRKASSPEKDDEIWFQTKPEKLPDLLPEIDLEGGAYNFLYIREIPLVETNLKLSWFFTQKGVSKNDSPLFYFHRQSGGFLVEYKIWKTSSKLKT